MNEHKINPETEHRGFDIPFVGREDTLGEVQAILEAVREGKKCDPIRMISGVKGSGKSAVLRELRRQYGYRKSVQDGNLRTLALLLDAQQGSADMMEGMIQQLSGDIHNQLGDEQGDLSSVLNSAAAQRSLDGVGAAIARYCTDHGITPLLLVDSVGSLDIAGLTMLADKLILPVVTQGKGAGVLGDIYQYSIRGIDGRGRALSKVLRLAPYEQPNLRPMTTDESRHMWDLFDTGLPYERIAPYEVGSPWVVKKLAEAARARQTRGEEPIDQELIAQVLGEYKGILLSGIPDDLIDAITTLSPLMDFRSYELGEMRGDTEQEQKNISLIQCRALIHIPQAAHLSRVRRATVLEPVLRATLQSHLRLTDPGKYLTGHMRACKMYNDLLSEYTGVATRFTEFLYHLGKLYEANRDEELMHDGINHALKFIPEVVPDRIGHILDTLKNDPEIKAAVPPAFLTFIIKNITEYMEIRSSIKPTG